MKYPSFPRLIVVLISFQILITGLGCKGKCDQLNLSIYQYRDTKNLVCFVYEASQMIEQKGESGIEYLKKHRENYYSDNFYLYVYDMEANAIFHAGMPDFEGRNLREVKDINGKNIFDMIIKAINDSGNPHNWVHYSWWEPGNFYPVPKSSCHFVVTTPENKILIVGGGINYPQEEREFARIIVDNAAQILQQKGDDAFEEIQNPISIYNFRDVKVFAFKSDTSIIISPVIENNLLDLDLFQATDPVGNKPFQLAVNQLEKQDSVWQVFMARNRYQRQLVKKIMYLRKIETSWGFIFIGAITDLPEMP
ncbi:MAG: calcium:proton antiporter [Desulfuromonas sp. SDB]|nr:MAG: calcium:proton antiporter [Desulfuromonas sp. SDB]